MRPRFNWHILNHKVSLYVGWASDGHWWFKMAGNKRSTDFFAFGTVVRKGDEDIHVVRLVVGPLLVVLGVL